MRKEAARVSAAKPMIQTIENEIILINQISNARTHKQLVESRQRRFFLKYYEILSGNCLGFNPYDFDPRFEKDETDETNRSCGVDDRCQ